MRCARIDKHAQTTNRWHLLWWTGVNSKSCHCYRL